MVRCGFLSAQDRKDLPGCAKLLARLGCAYRKPRAVPRVAAPESHAAFIAADERLLNVLEADAILTFLRQTIPKNWRRFRDQVTDNFRIISPQNPRVLG